MAKRIIGLLLTVACIMCLLSGCLFKTVDELYSIPKRPEDYTALQSAIEKAMAGLEYCAPTQGENQQTVQLADLTGDGNAEAILFAKGSDEKPLKILVFSKVDGIYQNIATLEFSGTAFEQVEYGKIDEKGGLELIIGRQMGNEVLHTLSVYSFAEGTTEPLLTAGYTRFLMVDLDGDERKEVFVLRPGSEAGNGVAELYRFKNGAVERATEAAMSAPVEKLKRIATGGLWSTTQAVFVASNYDDDTIITDVYAMVNGRFTNVSLSNESATSIQTIRNYYVYSDDIDGDGCIELPALLQTDTQEQQTPQDFIRWYNLTPTGREVEKVFTYHNYAERWYVRLNSTWARLVQVDRGNVRGSAIGYVFSIQGKELFTIYAYTGSDRDVAAEADNGFILNKTDEVTYGATLGSGAGIYEITRAWLVEGFNFIREDWKTGET